MKNKSKPLFESVIHFMRPYHRISTSNRLAELRYGLSLSQFLILLTLQDSPGISASRLAEKIGTHSSSLSLVLQKLVRKKFVSRMPNARDRRQTFIFLSDEGHRCLKDCREPLLKLLYESGMATYPANAH